MSGPCTDCGGPDYQTLVVRITELEADKETADFCIEHLSLDNERMEATIRQMTNSLQAIREEHEDIPALVKFIDGELSRWARGELL